MIWSPERAKETISWPRKMDAGTRQIQVPGGAALRSQKADAEIARAYQVHPITLSKWKKEFWEKGAEVFGGRAEVRASAQKISKLERLLGQKEVELALLKNFLDES
ncbi:MAG: transposase [Acidobacteria bacterium]|nr:transposase [Acidobacteriota bacterium]